MPITAVEPPVRTRDRESLFTEDEANEAQAVLVDGKAAQHGVYEDENKARSAGYALSRMIERVHGSQWRVSAWTDAEGQAIGALLPKPRIKREKTKRLDEAQTNGGEPAAQEPAEKQSTRGRGRNK